MLFDRVKPLNAILRTAEKKALHRSLGAFQLTMLGHRRNHRHRHIRTHRRGCPKGWPWHVAEFRDRRLGVRRSCALLL